MTTDTLKNALGARPYRPFSIHLDDGRSVRVEHPDFAVYVGGRVLVVLDAKDRSHYVDLLEATDLQVDPPSAGREASGTN